MSSQVPYGPPETLLQVMFKGRSQPFLVGLTPNQDAHDANPHLEGLYSVYLSVWDGPGGSRGL